MDVCNRRFVEIRNLGGVHDIRLTMESTSTIFELKKTMHQWFLKEEQKDIPRIAMQLVHNTSVLDSGNATLDDIEKGSGTLVLSLVIRWEPVWAVEDDFDAFRNAGNDSEITSMIQDRGLAWRIETAKPYAYENFQKMSPDEIESVVGQMDPELVQHYREYLGLNVELSSLPPEAHDTMFSHFLRMHMHHALDATSRSFDYFFLSFMREGSFATSEEFKKQVPFLVRSAVSAGVLDEEHVKDMLIVIYDNIESLRKTKATYDMIEFLVSRKCWSALEEQVRLQPELLTHKAGRFKTKYAFFFPELYSSVLLEANLSFVQLLLEAGLQIDAQHLLSNIKYDRTEAIVARLKWILDLDRSAIHKCMAWAAQQAKPDYLELMLDVGIDPSLDLSVDSSLNLEENASALSLAIESKCPDNITLLLDRGAHVSPEMCETMERRATEQQHRVAWIRSRQDLLLQDFPYCYDERKKRLEEENQLLGQFKGLLPSFQKARDKRRRTVFFEDDVP